MVNNTLTEELKLFVSIYHKRNKLKTGTVITNELWVARYQTDMYTQEIKTNKIIHEISGLHRPKFKHVEFSYYIHGNGIAQSRIIKNKSGTFITRIDGNDLKINQRISLDVEYDEFFNNSLQFNIPFSYEESQLIKKLLSEVHHSFRIYR